MTVLRVLLLSLLTVPAFAQNFGFQEPFHLVSLGNGAAAIGMGGSFVAIADDLSALYWNPAGLSSKPGFSIQFDGLKTTGSENFAVRTNASGTSQHDYSVSGFQPQSFAASYQFKTNDLVLGPSFGWSRSSLFLSDYKMDQAAMGHFNGINFSEDADYSSLENLHFDRSGEDTYSFAFSLRKGNRFSFGVSLNVLGGSVTRDQSIHQTAEGTMLFFPDGSTAVIAPFSSVLDRSDHLVEDYSGKYLNFGILFRTGERISIGGSLKTGYKRKADQLRSSTFDFDLIGPAPASDHRSGEFEPVQVEYDVPAEISGGVAILLNPKVRIASSLAYANYETSENPPGQEVLYPSYRTDLTFQSNLLQWRNGVEITLTQPWRVRAGFIFDGQPYSKQFYPLNEPDDSQFHAFTLGAGYSVSRFSVDIAYMHETGEAFFGNRLGGIIDHDVEFSDGTFSHNRIFFSFGIRQ